jgi:hypothetical protein
VSLDHGCGLDQHHHLQAARPSSVGPDLPQAITSTKARSAAPMPVENRQLVSEGQRLKFQRAEHRVSAQFERVAGSRVLADYK